MSGLCTTTTVQKYFSIFITILQKVYIYMFLVFGLAWGQHCLPFFFPMSSTGAGRI